MELFFCFTQRLFDCVHWLHCADFAVGAVPVPASTLVCGMATADHSAGLRRVLLVVRRVSALASAVIAG